MSGEKVNSNNNYEERYKVRKILIQFTCIEKIR